MTPMLTKTFAAAPAPRRIAFAEAARYAAPPATPGPGSPDDEPAPPPPPAPDDDTPQPIREPGHAPPVGDPGVTPPLVAWSRRSEAPAKLRSLSLQRLPQRLGHRMPFSL